MSNPPSLQPASSPVREGRLDSWKEIATYLNRTVRTIQRWEQTERLPVHRHGHGRRDSVYAYVSELDAWWTADQPHQHLEEIAKNVGPRPHARKEATAEGKHPVHMVFEKQLLKRLDAFRFKHRFESRTDAAKWLLDWSLSQKPQTSKATK